jgi:NADP-dependent 3-hydroxy acid dehydrogenase YdfG
MTPERKVVVITGASRGIGAQLLKDGRSLKDQGVRIPRLSTVKTEPLENCNDAGTSRTGSG